MGGAQSQGGAEAQLWTLVGVQVGTQLRTLRRVTTWPAAITHLQSLLLSVRSDPAPAAPELAAVGETWRIGPTFGGCSGQRGGGFTNLSRLHAGSF